MTEEKKKAPSLVGEGGRSGEGAGSATSSTPPTPNPSPQGGGDAPYLAKRRLPTDSIPARAVGAGSPFSRGAAIVYLIAALAAFGGAAYMALIRHAPILSVGVMAPAIGGLWFLLRLFMVARAPKRESKTRDED